MAQIEIKDIRKVYRVDTEKIVALNRINLSIEQGEICCIFGTSGSGKSTLRTTLRVKFTARTTTKWRRSTLRKRRWTRL